MSTLLLSIFVLFVLFFITRLILLFIYPKKVIYNEFNCVIEGDIVRNVDPITKQFYVIDPHSGGKFYVNQTDDTYQDDVGRVWRMI